MGLIMKYKFIGSWFMFEYKKRNLYTWIINAILIMHNCNRNIRGIHKLKWQFSTHLNRILAK